MKNNIFSSGYLRTTAKSINNSYLKPYYSKLEVEKFIDKKKKC